VVSSALLASALTGCGSAPEYQAESAELGAPTLQAFLTQTAPVIDGTIDGLWSKVPPVRFVKDTSGNPTGPVTQVRALWSKEALYVLWELQGARFNVDQTRPVALERTELYNEDCVELFLTPDKSHPERYLELELGPFGHFFDLSIDRGVTPRKEDATWNSGAVIATTRDVTKQTAIIEAKFTAPEIVKALRAGASLPLGLFRIEGKAPNRQYLAWSPPLKKDFHVISAFGWLSLKGSMP
jgi:hypothetical protein